MGEIPSVFWMIVIGGLSAMLGLIFYYIAMVFKEVSMTVHESQDLIRNSNEILSEAKESVSIVNDSVKSIKTKIIDPILQIGNFLSSISEFAGKTFRNRFDREES